MARTTVEDPIKVFRFRVEIPQFSGVRLGFSEVTGLESETEVAEYREGGMNSTPQKSPGLTKFTDLVLKRGQLFDAGLGADFMYAWTGAVYSASRGASVGSTLTLFRYDLFIGQYANDNSLVRRWKLVEAWPKKWKPFSDLNGTSSDNSIEELTLAHEGFERIQ